MPILLLILLTSFSAQASQTAYVHLFEWKWNDIAKECTDYLGPKGFSAVQVSPPNEHSVLNNFPWYQRYQPVSYSLSSRSGSEAEFINMVRTCQRAGVDIYVDLVINHMTSNNALSPTLTGSAGSKYGHFEYPGLFGHEDFHHCDRYADDDIRNWSDRWEVQNCELGNLADLKTESPFVQSKVKAYFQKLVSIGVKGFRIDAAKHVPVKDLQEVLSEVKNQIYIYQEIISQPSEPIQAREYFPIGAVTEFRFGGDMANMFLRGKLAWINNNTPLGESWGYSQSSKSVMFIDNHDTQRDQGSLTHKQKVPYLLANIFMLAWPYGYPQIMSSYVFQNRNQGPPSDSTGKTKDVQCLSFTQIGVSTQGWVCEHRWDAIAQMVGFRKRTSGIKSVSNWWSNQNNQIAFSLGQKGFVVINHEAQSLNQKLQTGLAPGVHRDIIQKTNITVDQAGMVSVNLPPESAMVIE